MRYTYPTVLRNVPSRVVYNISDAAMTPEQREYLRQIVQDGQTWPQSDQRTTKGRAHAEFLRLGYVEMLGRDRLVATDAGRAALQQDEKG